MTYTYSQSTLKRSTSAPGSNLDRQSGSNLDRHEHPPRCLVDTIVRIASRGFKMSLLGAYPPVSAAHVERCGAADRAWPRRATGWRRRPDPTPRTPANCWVPAAFAQCSSLPTSEFKVARFGLLIATILRKNKKLHRSSFLGKKPSAPDKIVPHVSIIISESPPGAQSRRPAGCQRLL